MTLALASILLDDILALILTPFISVSYLSSDRFDKNCGGDTGGESESRGKIRPIL